jgi:hypothetical protein
MATVKGKSVVYGIAGGLQTAAGVALTGVAAVTSTDANANSETKRIRGNDGNTEALVFSNNTDENFSNESEMTMTVNLIKFPGSSFSDL